MTLLCKIYDKFPTLLISFDKYFSGLQFSLMSFNFYFLKNKILELIAKKSRNNNRITVNHKSQFNEQFQIIAFLLQKNQMGSEEELINNQLHELQDRIIDKISDVRAILQQQDKAIVDEIVMKKSHSTDPIYPKYDKKVCYYQQFWKVYLLNEIMIAKIKDYSIQNKQLSKDVQQLDEVEKQWSNLWTQKSKKKIRRTSDMIEKVYECPFERCGRTYGSDVSLNLHMKLKHKSGTKTERQALAKEICLAQEKGILIKVDLNFPPGYLQQFRQNFIRENS